MVLLHPCYTYNAKKEQEYKITREGWRYTEMEVLLLNRMQYCGFPYYLELTIPSL